MSTRSTSSEKLHVGRNLKRYREMMGIKQGALAIDLGDDWNQKKVSRLEERAEIDKETLQKVSKILNISMEAIEHQDADKALVNIQNNYEGSNNSGMNNGGVNSAENGVVNIFNPYDEIKQLHEENKALYERLLAAEKEKNEMLKQMLDKLK